MGGASRTRRSSPRPTPSCLQVGLVLANSTRRSVQVWSHAPLHLPSAGHDTTASAICWTLYNLACHAHFQDRCRQEVVDLMRGRDGEEMIQWSVKPGLN